MEDGEENCCFCLGSRAACPRIVKQEGYDSREDSIEMTHLLSSESSRVADTVVNPCVGVCKCVCKCGNVCVCVLNSHVCVRLQMLVV